MSGVRVVIPSLLGDVARLSSICDAAARAGASPVVIANGAHLCRLLADTDVPHLTSRRNDGFAASVVMGAEGEWSWLVILNDDLDFDPDELASCLSTDRLDAFGPAALVHFDNEPPRTIPTRLGVLSNVSLLSNVVRRASRRWHTPKSVRANSYHSFSAVAIGRPTWDRIGGLDTRFPFTYEDADFVRRAMGAGTSVNVMPTNIVHLHSQTGGRFIETVLPVSTWSALEYLTKWYGTRRLNRCLLGIALGVRAVIVVAMLPRPRRQLLAVTNAARALLADEIPSLPEWENA